MNKKKYIWVVIGILMIIGGFYYWHKKSNSKTTAVQYVTQAAEKGTLTVSVTGTGQVEAVNQVDLKSVVAGDAIDVIKVYVKDAQAVKKGDLIALLDSEDAQKSVRNSELSFKNAKIKYEQAKRDYKKGTINKLSFQAQEISYQQSQNSLADAKEKLQDYSMRAPFDGIVTDLSVSAGDSVSRSDVLASIITKDVQANIVLNEVDAVSVKEGDKAIVSFDALPNLTLTGKISKINTIGTVSQGVVSYDAQVTFDTQSDLLKPGMNVSASIITDAKVDVLLVPLSAIKSSGNRSYVEVLNDGDTPERKTVQVGASNDTQTEITGGISEGDKVVTQTINPSASNATSATSSGGSSGRLRIPGVTGRNR